MACRLRGIAAFCLAAGCGYDFVALEAAVPVATLEPSQSCQALADLRDEGEHPRVDVRVGSGRHRRGGTVLPSDRPWAVRLERHSSESDVRTVRLQSLVFRCADTTTTLPAVACDDGPAQWVYAFPESVLAPDAGTLDRKCSLTPR